MSITVNIGGNDLSSYVISMNRTEKLCVPGQDWEVLLDLNCPHAINPWHATVLHEEGTKVLTGYVYSVERKFGPDVGISVRGLDTWKRATDGWNDTEYVTSGTETVQGLMRHYMDLAGLTYNFNTDVDDYVPANLVIQFQPYSEILLSLASALNIFFRIDADGIVQIGDVVSDGGNGPDIATADNLIEMDVMTSDERARNKVIVWGPTGTGVAHTLEDWARVDHTLVYASPYCNSPSNLAAFLHANLHTLEVVKTAEVVGDATRRVGQRVDITGPANTFTGKALCTTIKSSYDEGGYIMQATHDERCAIFGAGPGADDGRDVIVATYECGVWRCKDIWADPPVWEPVNTGLSTNHVYSGVDQGSSFNCEWFIRDPGLPSTMAFLLTKIGLLKTDTLEPGYENWEPALMNYDVGDFYGDTGDHTWFIKRIRSTVARVGCYYVAVEGPNVYQSPNYETTFVGMTNDRFTSFYGGPDPAFGNYHTLHPPIPGADASVIYHSGLWGDCNYGEQKSVAVATWHRDNDYVSRGEGGFAAWHRNDKGCTVSGVSSSISSNGWPTYWECKRATYHPYPELFAPDNILRSPRAKTEVHPWTCFGLGNPLSPPNIYSFPLQTGFLTSNGHLCYKHCPTIHIPYDQTYNSDGTPSQVYFLPGQWVGGPTSTTAIYPTKNGVAITNLPWGGDPDSCHRHQGALGTYTPNADYVYCWSYNKPSRLAVSDDGCTTWEEKSSVPFYTSCFSGFPRSEQKIYAGRHPIRDATSSGDKSLIYVSWDRGDTWTDVTGNLWDETQALEIRDDGYGNPLGASGLVTIAPAYTK